MKFVINTNYKSAGTSVLNGLEKRLRNSNHEVSLNDWGNYHKYDIAIFMAPDSKIREAKKENPKLLCGIFDPKVSLSWQIKEIKSADFLVVSSIEQKDYLLKYNKNIFIYYMFPDIEEVKKEHIEKNKIIIGYHGNKQHLSAMKDVSWALDELAKKYNIEFWAIYNINKLGKWDKNVPKICPIKHMQWSEENLSGDLSQCDIGVVPSTTPSSSFWGRPFVSFLNNSEGYHNNDYVQRFKFSNNPGRIYVFSQLDIPVVTDFTPSACQIIKEGESGYLVGTKEGWYEALKMLINNVKIRKDFSENLKRCINDNYSTEQTFLKFISFVKLFYEKKYFKLILILLVLFSLLLTIFAKSFLYIIWDFSKEREQIMETYSTNKINEVKILNRPMNPEIKSGSLGSSDETIREIGNIVYSKSLDKYFLYYTGHSGSINLNNNVFVHVASSIDGISWTKNGLVMDQSSEDPYVIINNNIFYMFYEDKNEVPFRKINIAKSIDGINFDYLGTAIEPTQGNSWDNIDVSSPVVIFDKINSRWIMLYEGRSKKNRGAIGCAYSNDLINWDKKNDPVFIGGNKNFLTMYFSDYNFLVPDDIVYKDNLYFLTYHASGHKRFWQSFIASSTDLLQWKRESKFPISANYAVMLFDNSNVLKFFIAKKEGIFFMDGLGYLLIKDYPLNKQLE